MTKLLITNPAEECQDSLASSLSAGELRRTVLAYHEVMSSDSDYLYSISAKTFESHLQLIADIRLSVDGGAREPILSFDDGHISNYCTALPILEKRRCKAIFFVIVSRIGNRDDFMTWAHLRELVSLGHRVEAHSWSHPFLTKCSDSDLNAELVRSKNTLEDRLGAPVSSVSAPHGRWNKRVALACAQSGYKHLYTSDPWMTSKLIGRLDIVGRLMVQKSMTSAFIRKELEMSQKQIIVQRVRYALKQSTRHLLGDGIYHRLWLWHSGWTGSDDLS